jgi:MoaA/NifB/PqqE/SkfB family radical SAM enzyme
MENIYLSKYLNKGIKRIISDVLIHSEGNPNELVFISKFYQSSVEAAKRRVKLEKQGDHIPAFLISSIAEQCNLKCTGCYAREIAQCKDYSSERQLSAEVWNDIFCQASYLGISFHLLAGGEPLLRKDVLIFASKIKDTVFPIFTNGTLLDEEYLDLFDTNRNLKLFFSLEGDKELTDARRGSGTFDAVINSMQLLQSRNITFGASITVTAHNLSLITSDIYIDMLASRGCRFVIFVEYVPVIESTEDMSLTDSDRITLEHEERRLQEKFRKVLFLSFPGDEKFFGGCLAAGRGFFHINPYGDAEACPFSPFSDRSLVDYSLLEAIRSPFFKKLADKNLVGGEHTGGCALFSKKDSVAGILSEFVN